MRGHGYRRRFQQQVAELLKEAVPNVSRVAIVCTAGVVRRDKFGLWRPYRIPSPPPPYSLAATKPTMFDSDCICLTILPTSFHWQLGLGEADSVELAFQRSLNHRRLVGTKKVGHVIRGRLGGKARDRIGAFARRAGEPRAARTALLFNHD